jgi:hypothetical protein
MVLLETLMDYVYVQYQLIIQKKKHSTVAQKNNFNNGCMTFVSREKLQRFICTISGQLKGVALEDPDLLLDRIGSHTEENLIGNIRSICHGDNRIDNVEHQLARFELARSKLALIGVKKKIDRKSVV